MAKHDPKVPHGRMTGLIRPLMIAGLAVESTYAAVQLIRQVQPPVSWAGLLLCAAGPLAFLLISRRANRAPHPFGFSIACGLGLAITMSQSWRYGEAAGIIHIWAGLTLIIWVLYLRLQTRFKPF